MVMENLQDKVFQCQNPACLQVGFAMRRFLSHRFAEWPRSRWCSCCPPFSPPQPVRRQAVGIVAKNGKIILGCGATRSRASRIPSAA